MTEIIEHTVMEQPTISRVIAQLTDEGLVTRAMSGEDSRISLISLSPRGEALFDEISPAVIRNQSVALEGLSPQELDLLTRALEKIEASIDLDR